MTVPSPVPVVGVTFVMLVFVPYDTLHGAVDGVTSTLNVNDVDDDAIELLEGVNVIDAFDIRSSTPFCVKVSSSVASVTPRP